MNIGHPNCFVSNTNRMKRGLPLVIFWVLTSEPPTLLLFSSQKSVVLFIKYIKFLSLSLSLSLSLEPNLFPHPHAHTYYFHFFRPLTTVVYVGIWVPHADDLSFLPTCLIRPICVGCCHLKFIICLYLGFFSHWWLAFHGSGLLIWHFIVLKWFLFWCRWQWSPARLQL